MTKLLQTLRCEKKYGLDLILAKQMQHKLQYILQKDSHGNSEDGYRVRSLYFDTIDNSDFYDKVDGYHQRRKIRLRVYPPNAQFAKLEIKAKEGDLQLKRSVTLDKATALKLCYGDFSPLMEIENDLTKELYGRLTTKLYRPACVVEYDRTAFVSPINDIRITIDKNLRASESNFNLFDENLIMNNVTLFDSVTLEVKYNNFLLSYIKDMLALHEYPQSSISKYCAARSITLQSD
ncbi:MAG: polyphosphate polymerase domain-containing protein [Lachnospiraceae bacterium]